MQQPSKKTVSNSCKVSFLLVLMLAACASNRRKPETGTLKVTGQDSAQESPEAHKLDEHTTATEHKAQALELLKLCEAKWPDVPLVFASQRLEAFAEESDDARSCLFYVKTDQTRKQLHEFYEQEMERAGWRATTACCLFPSCSLLLYDKPYKSAAIKLVPNQEDTSTRIECVVTFKTSSSE